eukprot:CAMPEP_0113545356 /NCGR_PEP_ID=MMETSP0015_2-20120614/11216_1 /TAXON_ID=2838 /ORGANISM="Odontella" /LENGTH=547 /DNA_ID=CAMNT_0000445713 /DNA_START=242 /DNA_END=1885 /DNA_ORIENTATION=+ /assembly_acc=CAM_ASM_000160
MNSCMNETVCPGPEAPYKPCHSTILRQGISRHQVGDLNGAMDCYERALRIRLEAPSPEVDQGNMSRSDESFCPANATVQGGLTLPEPQLVGDDAKSDSSLIGMGRYVKPLLHEAFHDLGEEATTAVLLFNISLIKISQQYFKVAANLLHLALLDMYKIEEKVTDRTEGGSSSSTILRLMICTNLGHALYRLRRFDEAANRFEEAASLPGMMLEHARRRQIAASRRDMGSADSIRNFLRTLIGTLLHTARARDAAGNMPEQALALAREARGLCETLLTCFSTFDQNDDAGQQEDYAKARVDGGLSTIAAYVEAIVQLKRCKLDQAEVLYRQCLEGIPSEECSPRSSSPSSLGCASPFAPLRSASLYGLGRALFQRRRVEESVAYLRAAWSLRARALGEAHPDTIEAFYSMGRALHDADELTDALSVYERAHRIQVRLRGPGHPDSLRTLCNVARVRRTCGLQSEALEACKEAVREGKATLGERHAFVLDMLTMTGAILHDIGRPSEASAVLYEVLRCVDDSQAKMDDLLSNCPASSFLAGVAPGAAAA